MPGSASQIGGAGTKVRRHRVRVHLGSRLRASQAAVAKPAPGAAANQAEAFGPLHCIQAGVAGRSFEAGGRPRRAPSGTGAHAAQLTAAARSPSCSAAAAMAAATHTHTHTRNLRCVIHLKNAILLLMGSLESKPSK